MMVTDVDKTDKTAPSEVEVRLSSQEDLAAMLDISNWAIHHTTANLKCSPDTLEHWQQQWQEHHESYPCFVAERDGVVVGFALASPFSNRCGLFSVVEVSVYVDHRFHGEGIGTSLYRILIPTLEAQGYKNLIATMVIPNVASEQLHEKFGFLKVGTLSNVGWKLGQRHDVSYWQRSMDHGKGQPQPIKTVRDIDIIHDEPGRFTPDTSTTKGESQ